MTAWPDVEGALRDYLRADTGVSALVGNRVFFGIPPRVKFPLVVVRRVAGGQDPGEAPLDRPILMVDVWGVKGHKQDTYTVTAAVRDALTKIRGRTVQGLTCFYGAIVSGVSFFPDPDTDQPRYALTVDVMARAVPA